MGFIMKMFFIEIFEGYKFYRANGLTRKKAILVLLPSPKMFRAYRSACRFFKFDFFAFKRLVTYKCDKCGSLPLLYKGEDYTQLIHATCGGRYFLLKKDKSV